MKTNATCIWYDNNGEGLNRYALFRRNFELTGRPESALFHLFADERYRLIVNGQTVCHGPARFKLGYPEFDTIDIAQYLQEGPNVIAVMVCAYGQHTFISDDTHGGFIAWGDIAQQNGPTIELSTGPEWKAIRSAGHRETDQKMTFAIGLPELLDARKLPARWAEADFDDAQWPPAVALKDQDHWGELRPRSIPMLDESTVPVSASLGAWAVQGAESDADHPFEANRAFDRAERIAETVTLPWNPPATDAAVSLLVKFANGEVLGRVLLDITAPEGTIVDLLYTERIDENGRPIHGYQNTRMAERCICREGRQTWHTMHPRGFVFLEVVIRGDFANITLNDLRLTRAAYPVEHIGAFRCSDETLNAIWRLCRDTQEVCMEDAFLDCPWRERGLYTGDMLVQYYSNLALFGDHRLMRRCIWLFFLTQDEGESGLLAPSSHGLTTERHPDYSAIAVQALYHYWARSGDTAFLKEMAPRLVRLMEALRNLQVEDGHLADAAELKPYIDLAHFDREGVSCALNCYIYQAFHDAAEIMRLIGDDKRAETYAIEAEAIGEAVRTEFWDAERNLFVDRLKTKVPDTQPSLHANTLPMLYGIATEEQEATVLPFVLELMRNNFRVEEPKENKDCNVTSYFSFHPLRVLSERGKTREAEDFIRTYWGRYLEEGAVNTWEYFVDRCSRCHAWSTSPVHFFARDVLGVRPAEDGDPDRIRIAPSDTSLDWAEGVYPHPRGPIRVEWKKKDGKIDLSCEVPEGVELVKG